LIPANRGDGASAFFLDEGGGFSLGDEEKEGHEEEHGPQAGQEDRKEDLEEEDFEEVTSLHRFLVTCRLRQQPENVGL
jgi:hypothetical protein